MEISVTSNSRAWRAHSAWRCLSYLWVFHNCCSTYLILIFGKPTGEYWNDVHFNMRLWSVLPLFSWRPTYQGCVFPLLSPTGPNYNALLFVLPPFVGQGSRGGSFPAQRIMGISWKGGWRHSQAPPPPPFGHCPRDVTRPPGNWKTPPLLNVHKPPPFGHCPWRHPHSKGGGVIIPVTPPPWIRHCNVGLRSLLWLHHRASHYILWRSVVTLRHLLSSGARVGKNPVMVASELFF